MAEQTWVDFAAVKEAGAESTRNNNQSISQSGVVYGTFSPVRGIRTTVCLPAVFANVRDPSRAVPFVGGREGMGTAFHVAG